MERITSKHVNEVRILSYVAMHPDCTAGDLHEGNAYTHLTATSKAIRFLSKDGFIEIKRDDDDGRRVRLRVTAQGREYLDILCEEIRSYAQELLEIVSNIEIPERTHHVNQG